MAKDCAGCKNKFEESLPRSVDVVLAIKNELEGFTISSTYCPACTWKVMAIELDYLHDQLDAMIEASIEPRKTSISISEKEVRTIAKNLGASQKLTEALVEHVFGAGWTGTTPEGAIMNRFENRDRLVCFVAQKLKDLWFFKP